MHGAGAAADGLRQRLPRAARAGAHRRRRAPAARGAHRHPLDAPRVRARPRGRRGLGCPQSIQNCCVTAAGGAYRDPSPAAVLARRGQCGARPAVGARRRSQCRRRASAHLARRAKLFRFPRLAPVPVNTQVLSQSFTQKLRACYALTKPRVVSLIVFTAVIGMFLATPGAVSIQILLAGTAGIALVAGAAAAINCLVEQKTDAMLLFLIIFAWTPPHFWSLALYRTEDYARAGVPMLPVTHGKPYTRLQVLLYTLILFAVTLLPYVVRMSGWLYLGAAIALGGIFVAYALRLYFAYSDLVAQKTFRYSIVYLAALFAALLADHYL